VRSKQFKRKASLKKTFQKNGCNTREMQYALQPMKKHRTPETNLTDMATVMNIDMISGKTRCWPSISRMPVKKSNNMLQLVKDNLGYNVLGIYHILCENGTVYVGQTQHTMTARCKEYNTT
jgi:hypothetical protein